MNLIEQLGGYARAIKMSKEWESSIDGDIPLDTMMYSYDFGIFSWGDLQSALLEYRRQHSIFEVGDKVKAKDHQFGFDELFRIDDFFANDDGVNLAVLDDGDCYPISFLEHATDAEIKAGKRLEVL